MTFRTTLKPRPQQPKIEQQSQILSLGSCFSDAIGAKLQESKLQIKYNPFGVLFNPISIFNVLELALTEQEPELAHYIEQSGLWKHFDFHSQISASSEADLHDLLKQTLAEVKNWIANTDVLILTFGTAWIHQLNSSKTIVANCHKVPSTQFNKQLLAISQIEEAFQNIINLLPKKTQILLTVSPVRHIKEGLTLNQVSKSVLRLFCHEATEKYERVSYFPSYELLLDDLRDYRFYKDDFIHPTDFAVNYIWEHFLKTHVSDDCQRFIADWQKIQRELEHKALHPESVAHQNFLKKLLLKLKKMESSVDVAAEIASVEEKILED